MVPNVMLEREGTTEWLPFYLEKRGERGVLCIEEARGRMA